MASVVTYVHVDEGSTFSCCTSDGTSVDIGASPVGVPASLVAYLDECSFVKRAGEYDAPDEDPEAEADEDPEADSDIDDGEDDA